MRTLTRPFCRLIWTGMLFTTVRCVGAHTHTSAPSTTTSDATRQEARNDVMAANHETHTMHHRFDNAEHWAVRFEDPERATWQKPDQVIEALKLPPDAKVADIGAATGYFAVRLARALPNGKVYGVDIEQNMVRFLAARAKSESLGNLEAILATNGDPRLPQEVDLALTVNTYHHIDERVGYFSRLKRSMTERGQLAVIDWKKEAHHGPPPQFRARAEEIVEELTKAGWTLSSRHDFLPEQNFLVFSPTRSSTGARRP